MLTALKIEAFLSINNHLLRIRAKSQLLIQVVLLPLLFLVLHFKPSQQQLALIIS